MSEEYSEDDLPGFSNKESQPVMWLGNDSSLMMDGRRWISGCGITTAKIMIVAPFPDRQALYQNKASQSRAWRSVYRVLRECNIDPSNCYFTFLCKFSPKGKKASAVENRLCAPFFKMELEKVNPDFVVCCGADVWKALAGKKAVNFSSVKNAPQSIDLTFDTFQKHVESLPIHNPEFLSIAPDELPGMTKAFQDFSCVMAGETASLSYTPNYEVISRAEDIEFLADSAEQWPEIKLAALDCEWHGSAWYKPGRCLRTVQLAFDNSSALVFALYGSEEDGAGGFRIVQKTDDYYRAWAALKKLLESPNIRFIGHNVKEDALWLSQYGVNIRQNVVFDTMLVETLLNQNGPYGLEDVALKYTDIPRWAVELEAWKKSVKSNWHSGGYGFIPDAVLEPYSAVDVIATYKIYEAQYPLVENEGYFEERNGYTSLFSNTMLTQDGLFEVEKTGLPVDQELLGKLVELFETRYAKMHAEISEEGDRLCLDYELKKDEVPPEKVEQYIQDRYAAERVFRPTSPDQVRYLLFQVLGITPFKTTKSSGGRLWEEAVSKLSLDDADALDELNPAADSTVLSILQDEHPMVSKLLNFSRLAQMRKTWLRYPEIAEDGQKSGGLFGDIGEDGKIHSRLTMGMATGRMSSSKPNIQNFPKKAQKFLKEIFKEELATDPFLLEWKAVPLIRNIVKPPDGYVIVEGDFCQAELFVLAATSGDQNMLRALNTPGLDLHTKTAVDGFGFVVRKPDSTLLEEAELLEFASICFRNHGGGTPEFNKVAYEDEMDGYHSKLTYIDAMHNEMTYKAFKSGPRVSAKALNFGIPYGRQELSIAIQIKAETGSKDPVSKITQNVNKMMYAWKNVSYCTAWSYMEQCSRSAKEDWIVTNPWGRSRRFSPTMDRSLLASYGRKGSNFPIQSTVADTCQLAFESMIRERAQRGLSFKFINLVHDAIMTLVPIDELDAVKQLYRQVMGGIKIPLGPDKAPLVLGVDIEVMSRWGQEYKKKTA